MSLDRGSARMSFQTVSISDLVTGDGSLETVAKPDKAAAENWLRPEGPVVNSPARKGGGLARPLARGPKARHTNCAAPSALHFISSDNHALTGVATFFRAFGPANARASQCPVFATVSLTRRHRIPGKYPSHNISAANQ
jgi:hypothetical protein